MPIDWQAVIVAIIGAIGLDRLIVFLLALRENKRKLAAEAHKVEHDAECSASAARKTDAEANLIQADADNKTLDGAFRLIDTLTKQMTTFEIEQGKTRLELIKLGRRLERAYGRIEYLMTGIRRLIDQIKKVSSEDPVWQPNEWQPEDDE